MWHSINGSWGPWHSLGPDPSTGALTARNPLFYVIVGPAAPRPGWGDIVGIRIGRTTWPAAGNGSYLQTTCFYSPAIVEYDIVIKDNVLSLAGDSTQGRFVRFANNTPDPIVAYKDKKELTALDLLTDFLAAFVNTNTSVTLEYSQEKHGGYYGRDWTTMNSMTMKYENNPMNTNVLFSNPLPDIVDDMNQLMLRGALKSASWRNVTSFIDSDISIHQSVVARQTLQQTVFHSHLLWFTAAAVVELMTVFLVLPMFFGYWQLGRHTTLSPFDIALAFDSSLFSDVNSAAGAKGVVRSLGSMHLRYGLIGQAAESDGEVKHRNAASGRLGFAPSVNVIRPRNGMQFSS